MMDRIGEVVGGKKIYRSSCIDILGVLTDMENYFRYQMKASLDVFNNYDIFSTETWDDMQLIRAKLRTLKEVQLITEHEYSELDIIFQDIRSEWLNNALEKFKDNKTEDNNNGN